MNIRKSRSTQNIWMHHLFTVIAWIFPVYTIIVIGEHVISLRLSIPVSFDNVGGNKTTILLIFLSFTTR